jgi:DUF4097 and DUF4098 domain-containing protein YvlB
MKAMLRPIVVLLALAVPASAFAATHERKETVRGAKARSLSVDNLAGAVKLEPTSGGEFIVAFTVVGGGDDAAEAKAMAERIKFETKLDGDRLTIQVRYPTDEFRSFYYDDGRGGSSNTQSTYMGERVRVSSRSGGADLHVDAVVQVPKGASARYANLVGDIKADKVVGDLDLDTGSGSVSARNGQGRVDADTGSGDVTVTDHVGEVDADTGSGDIELERVKGDLSADTGSGEVTLRKVTATRIDIDTGSGGIEIEDSSGSLEADTGSGGVRTRNYTAGERLEIDTGSGGARIQGDLGAVRDLHIDTGSGGVTLDSTTPLDLKLHVSVGSGDVDVDAPGMRDVRDREDEFEATLGQGRGRAEIETGSGGVRIRVGR